MKIYLERVGYRDVVNDKDEIMWFWEQQAKAQGYKHLQTRYWLNQNEHHRARLLTAEAFELVYFLDSKITDEQLKNRALWREKQKLVSQAETDKWMKWKDDYEEQNKLKSSLKNLN